MIVHEHSRDVISQGRMTSGALFWYVHGGLLETSERLQDWDPYLKRPVREVLDESLEKEWQYVWPKPGNDPRMMLVMGSNPLRRIRSYPVVLKHLWPKLHTVVTLDFRMTSTALQSDYVLPAAGWYERNEHKWVTPLMPYIHSGEKATTYYEAKSDWEIISLLAKAVDERAKARGMQSFVDRRGDERPLHNLYDKYSQGGRFGPTDDEKVCADLRGSGRVREASGTRRRSRRTRPSRRSPTTSSTRCRIRRSRGACSSTWIRTCIWRWKRSSRSTRSRRWPVGTTP
jgi:anaerobic selenocysteine-containing dehydrogenase